MTAPLSQTSASQDTNAPPATMLARRLAGLQDRLLNITARNRSILVGPMHQKAVFDLAARGPARAQDIVRRSMKGDAMVLSDRAQGDDAATLRKGLAALARHLKRQRDETGLRNGHIGFPFLVGALDDETWIRAPLILVPVRLHRIQGRGAGWHASLRDGTRPTANRALLAAIAKVRDVRLGDAFVEELEQLIDRHTELRADEWDWHALVADVGDLLAAHGLPVHGDDDAEVRPMVALTRKDRDARRGEALHLAPHAILGDFPQTNEPIHADYGALVDAASRGGSDVALLGRLLEAPEGIAPLPDEPEVPRLADIPDRELGTVVPSNARQTEVLLRARHKHCTVIRGPPGTGKSQVIVNLVSDALRHGEKVLVVCQKRAALDVVHDRLTDIGLGELALMVHDPQADRKATYERLARLLEGEAETRDVDAAALCEEVDGLVDALDSLAGLSAVEHNGLPRHAIYALADPGHRPRLLGHKTLQAAQWEHVQTARRTMDALGDQIRTYRLEHPWAQRNDLAKGTPPRANEVEQRTRRLLAAVDSPYHAADRDALEDLAQAFGTWHERRRRWWRFLDPAYADARRTVMSFLAAQDAAVDTAPEWARRVRQGLQVLDALDALDEVAGPRMRKALLGAAPGEALGMAQQWHAGVADWDRLVQVDRDVAGLAKPTRRLVLLALRRLGDRDRPAAALEQEALHTWIEQVEAGTPALRGDPFSDYERRRRRLARVMAQRRREMAQDIRAGLHSLASRPVAAPGHEGEGRPEADWHQAQARLRRQRNVPTMRALMQDGRFQHVWARAARCWLMSPEGVSAVHPAEAGLFDLVVFDEASQLAVERALPAIYRAKRVVIAGDEKQLPPFDLFQGQVEEEGEDLETESLLSLARAAFGAMQLEWHYRSAHQELVEFSNQAYYGGGLKVVPSPVVGARPLRYHAVPGRFIDRRNEIEAMHVLDVVHGLLRQDDPPTVGIVTFNKAQRDLIDEMVEARCTEDDDFARAWRSAAGRRIDDRPFIKNIENVQGDERDIIVFSTTYGPDGEGRVSTRFGIFNQRGGEHRLNVAITRARRAVHLVTSLDPDRLNVDASEHLGPKHLKAYLQYARAIDAGDDARANDILSDVGHGTQASIAPPSTPLHDAVCQALRNEGLHARTQVGYSGYRIDVAVAHPDDPNRLVLAVELDGDTFHAANGARERDVARPAFLEARGWRVERLWSRDWFRDPEGQTKRLVRAAYGATV